MDPEKTGAGHIDLGKILLPKKEGGPSVLSAQRINAAALLEQEQHATLLTEEGKAQPEKEPASQKPADDAVSVKSADSGHGVFPAGSAPEVPGSSASKPPPPATSSAPQGPTPPTKPAEESSEIKPLQTYRGDIEKVIHGTNASVVSIAAAEAARRSQGTAAPAETAPVGESRGGVLGQILMVFIGLVLIGAAAGLGAYIYLKAQPVTPQAAQQAPFISVDNTRVISVPYAQLGRNALMQALERAREEVRLPVGLVERVVAGISTSSSDIAEMTGPALLQTLAPGAPEELLRTVEPVFLLGVHSFDSNQAFVILRVDSFEVAYAAMLRWEYTLADELSPLFTRTPSPHAGGGQASTTEAATSTGPVIATNFADKIVENRDARVLQNSAGDILLLWTFLDRNTLVITTNEYTLREIISRFHTTSLVPQP